MQIWPDQNWDLNDVACNVNVACESRLDQSASVMGWLQSFLILLVGVCRCMFNYFNSPQSLMRYISVMSFKHRSDILTYRGHKAVGHDGVTMFSPQSSPCVEEVLITMCYFLARPALMYFLLFTLFSFPQSTPYVCFSADCGLWKSYFPFKPDQSPSYPELLNHKHFIDSDLTLTDVEWWVLGVKCLWRRVDAGLFNLNKMLGLLRCQTPSRHLRHA